MPNLPPVSPGSLSRRRWLGVGAGTIGGLGLDLDGLLRVRAQAAPLRSGLPPIRACILIFYYGGPSHLDTFDPKPDAPAEIRGEFRPIATSVPGLFVSEHLPLTARLMHRMALIRSLHHGNTLHDPASIETFTGRPPPTGDRELFSASPQIFPGLGGAIAHAMRERGLAVPFAAVPGSFRNVVEVPCQGGGFLGSACDPFRIEVDADSGRYRVALLERPEGLTPRRRALRRSLLDQLEDGSAWDGSIAGSGRMADQFERAFTLLDSEPVRRALDLEREDPRLRLRYGYDTPPASTGEGGGGGNGAELAQGRQMRGQNLLLARRLVEAGVPFVTVYDYRQQGQNWDAHFKCFSQHRRFLLPQADRGLAALVEDLEARGLLESTLVVGIGEFGRTPRINAAGGRDHWGSCYSAVLAGGGVRGGAVHGASDRIGAYPASDPVTPADLAATIYWRFGIDPATEVRDNQNRPFRLSEGQPIASLFA